mmetsp:Transcript_20409/g.60742  ORF Transcript_20409/g.60742 Transcript_20409/m.60742 type:complete len:298 (-) Transcript_20409:95-988(-)
MLRYRATRLCLDPTHADRYAKPGPIVAAPCEPGSRGGGGVPELRHVWLWPTRNRSALALPGEPAAHWLEGERDRLVSRWITTSLNMCPTRLAAPGGGGGGAPDTAQLSALTGDTAWTPLLPSSATLQPVLLAQSHAPMLDADAGGGGRPGADAPHSGRSSQRLQLVAGMGLDQAISQGLLSRASVASSVGTGSLSTAKMFAAAGAAAGRAAKLPSHSAKLPSYGVQVPSHSAQLPSHSAQLPSYGAQPSSSGAPLLGPADARLAPSQLAAATADEAALVRELAGLMALTLPDDGMYG